jgi:hypothetical protein
MLEPRGINFHINDPSNISDGEYKFTKTKSGTNTVWTLRKDWPWDEKHDQGAQQIKVGAEGKCDHSVKCG